MKMSREQLKALVKECLVEILEDGIGGSLRASNAGPRGMAESRTPKTRQTQQRQRQFDPALDTPVASRQQSQSSQAIKSVAGGNKVMEAILADTAATSLQTMLEGDRRSPGSHAAHGYHERIVEQTNPEELFGEEAASRWADLAFSDMPRSNRTNNPLDS